jgi:ABC-type glycerol-3-phosphate transport system substrate-binding protein
MLDLGDDLADYGGEAKVGTATLSDLTEVLATIPASTGHTVPLADLQRQGFNTTPPPGWSHTRRTHARS